MKQLTYILLIIIMISGCKKKDDYMVDPSKYVYPIPQTTLSDDARVGAYYSVYKTTDWNVARAYTPVLGTYDATTASVMQQHLKWADTAGLNFFAFKWNGTTDNTILNNFKTQATNSNVKMVIDYSTAHLAATNASPLVGAKLATFANDWRTLATTYINNQATYYKIDNRPVVMLSPLNLTASTLTSINYKLVADTLRSVMNTFGVNPFIIGELTTGWVAPLNYPDSILKAMDAIVLNTWSTTDYDRMFAFYSYSDMNYQNWKTTLGAWNVDYVPCIFPGWNNPSAPTQYVIPRTEKNYVDYCNVAKRSMGKQRIVMINSWNDFQKGNTLEPANEYGSQYLYITKRELKKN
ncbi:MAG: glycoside hydrolase family 99-like domain-containing protein [Candidatus Dadabacteria bacterium]